MFAVILGLLYAILFLVASEWGQFTDADSLRFKALYVGVRSYSRMELFYAMDRLREASGGTFNDDDVYAFLGVASYWQVKHRDSEVASRSSGAKHRDSEAAYSSSGAKHGDSEAASSSSGVKQLPLTLLGSDNTSCPWQMFIDMGECNADAVDNADVREPYCGRPLFIIQEESAAKALQHEPEEQDEGHNDTLEVAEATAVPCAPEPESLPPPARKLPDVLPPPPPRPSAAPPPPLPSAAAEWVPLPVYDLRQRGTHGTAQRRARTEEPMERHGRTRALQSRRSKVSPPEFPMPTRLPPFVMEGRHEVTPELDVDWTLCHDWDTELVRRNERNRLIKAQLQERRSVCYRSSGWSLYPRVHSNDCCTYDPVSHESEVQVDDIVFCEVQPGSRVYAHLVKMKEWQRAQQKWKFTISNMQGRENGWCFIEHIYGKLVHVEH